MSETDVPETPINTSSPPVAVDIIREPQAAGALLKQLFPALFAGGPRPIQLKVQQAIEARVPGRFAKKALSGFLARHTASTSYLIALTKSETRFDLDGQPAGELSPEHREAAKKLLAERRERVRVRDQEIETARRWRLDLLRDFETTRLSRPNFCALKGVEEAQLDALLEQARVERSAAPEKPAADRDNRRPGGAVRRNEQPRRDKPQRDARPPRRDSR
jgi:ProP effector